jgi:hypothetical protein
MAEQVIYRALRRHSNLIVWKGPKMCPLFLCARFIESFSLPKLQVERLFVSVFKAAF